MTTQEDIYNYLKKSGAKFKVKHLADIFGYHRNTLEKYVLKMMKNKIFYSGLKRESIRDVDENKREYICYVYYVEDEK